jgi:hypothetical protein
VTVSPEGKVTLGSQRSVLVVARNGASAFRALEVIKLFDDDARINLRVTVGPDSRYAYGVEQLLTSERIRLLPWEAAKHSTFDLVLSGGANACLAELNGPVVVFPHGAGHHKRPPAASDGERVFELTPEQLLRDGSVITSRLLLPGRDSMDRIRRHCEPAVDNAVIAGDPIAQQLRAHLPLRDTYRSSIGLKPGQRLVVVSSTWGPRSLAARSLDLIKRLVAELPVDEYRVAATFHHNVTVRDGHRELERILRSAVDAGLILIPPETSWQPFVIAADAVVGDHGSTTFYAADLVPVAIATDEPHDCPADSPMTALIEALPHIDEERSIRAQVEALIAKPQPETVSAIIDASIERDIDASAAFRSTMYELMDLGEPASPAFLSLDSPRPDRVEPTAYLVDAAVADNRVVLTRYPAAITPTRQGRHLVVRSDDSDPRRAQTANALVAVNEGLELADLLRRFPGCRVAVKALASGGVAVRVQDGSEIRAVADRPADADVAAVVASAYLALTREGRPIEGEATVECPGHGTSVRFGRLGA